MSRGRVCIVTGAMPGMQTPDHTPAQHIVSDINRNVQNARLGVISAGSGETHIVQTLP